MTTGRPHSWGTTPWPSSASTSISHRSPRRGTTAHPACPGGVDPAVAGEGPGTAAAGRDDRAPRTAGHRRRSSDRPRRSAARTRGTQSAGSAGRRRVRRPRTGTGRCAPQSTRPSPVTGRSSSSPANRGSARLGWPKRSRPTPGCGGQVLRGRSDDWEGAPAYWPWVQVVRDHVHDRDPQSLRSDLGQGAVDIAHVVSDVRERLPDLPSPPPLEPEQARFRLFDGLVRSSPGRVEAAAAGADPRRSALGRPTVTAAPGISRA